MFLKKNVKYTYINTILKGANMLDKIIIGTRIRKIREEIFEETREKFSKRCNLTERHIRSNRARRFFN